jgi:D-alanyl-D-alanine carboxypeptidase
LIVQGLTERLRSPGLAVKKSLIAIAILGFLSSISSAHAKYASIIIDGDSGQVLQETNADEVNYPASLTKMMTLYLAFEALRDGHLTLDQQLTTSAHAANRAPSKLNLAPGESVAVRDLVLGIVTKSANDAATVMAEGLAGGSESAFAEKMTQKARKLGMKNTIFYNASGLPGRPENQTTARDLVTLARALYRDFPQDYHYFATKEFTWRGATFANHNHLMNSFQGMDGIKTGYINASGFNLAASAVRDHRRLIGIVMGGQSARLRDAKMAQLLNDGFANKFGKVMVAKAEEPAAPETADDDQAEPSAAGRAVAALSPVGTAQAAPIATRKVAEIPGDAWSIQLGAFSKHGAAEKAAHAASKLALAKGKPLQIIAPSKDDKERLYRVRLVNFTKHEADQACTLLHRKHQKCSLVAPSPVKVART